MTAGAIIVPAIVPLRPPIPGKSKSSVDTNTKIELSSDQKDVDIFYTINGKKPDPFPKVGSERYTMQYFAPFTLPAGKQTVKAMAVSKDGLRESNVGTKIFEVEYVPSKEVAPVDDDLGFQEDLDKQNSTLHVKRAAKNLLLSEKTAWTDMATMKQTIQKIADENVSGSSYRKPPTTTRFLNTRRTVQDKNEYNKSNEDPYGRTSRHQDRDYPDAATQAMRLTREAELLKSYSEVQSDPFSRYYISRGSTGQQEARPIPPKPGKMGTCVYCKSVVPFNTASCVVCEGPIPLQYHQPNPELRSAIKERDTVVHVDRNGFSSGVESQWLPVTHPVGVPLRPTSTVSTQTVGLFYPSEKGLSNMKEELEKKVALEQKMRDRQPLMTPVSPGKGYWRKQVDHICHHLKAHAQNDAEFRALIGEPKMGKLLSGAVQEDGHELSITLTFAIRENKDPLTGRKLGITGDYLSMHTENDSLTSYRSDSEDEEIARITEKKKTVKKNKPRKKETAKIAPIDQKLLKELGPSGEGDPTEVQRLIDEGANATCTNKDGLPCIYVAIKNKRTECLPVLVDQGVEVNQKGPSSIKGNTPLHEAVSLGTSGLQVVDTLLGLGANIDNKNDRGETPYDLATKGGYENIVKKLCSHLGQSQLDKLMKQKTKV